MVSIPKIIGVMPLSYSLMLCLNLVSVTPAAEGLEPDTCVDRKDGQPNLATCSEKMRQGIHTMEGDVLRVEFDNLVVFQRSDGKQVRLHIDENTEMIGYVGPGEHVEAKVNEQRHALSIRLIGSP
jgi:hypothetical protein